jgi:hypothetical protein
MKAIALLILALVAVVPLAVADGDGAPDITLNVYPPQIHSGTGGTVHVRGNNFPLPGFPAWLVIGDSALNAPFGDYVMVPDPDLFVGVVTGFPAPGQTDLDFVVQPNEIPPGTTVYLQFWQDADTSSGTDWRGSNADTLAIVP